MIVSFDFLHSSHDFAVPKWQRRRVVEDLRENGAGIAAAAAAAAAVAAAAASTATMSNRILGAVLEEISEHEQK